MNALYIALVHHTQNVIFLYKHVISDVPGYLKLVSILKIVA